MRRLCHPCLLALASASGIIHIVLLLFLPKSTKFQQLLIQTSTRQRNVSLAGESDGWYGMHRPDWQGQRPLALHTTGPFVVERRTTDKRPEVLDNHSSLRLQLVSSRTVVASRVIVGTTCEALHALHDSTAVTSLPHPWEPTACVLSFRNAAVLPRGAIALLQPAPAATALMARASAPGAETHATPSSGEAWLDAVVVDAAAGSCCENESSRQPPPPPPSA